MVRAFLDSVVTRDLPPFIREKGCQNGGAADPVGEKFHGSQVARKEEVDGDPEKYEGDRKSEVERMSCEGESANLEVTFQVRILHLVTALGFFYQSIVRQPVGVILRVPFFDTKTIYQLGRAHDPAPGLYNV
jgi:hypothetical protein